MASEQHDVRAGLLSIRSRRDGDVHLIALEGELDLANAPVVETELATRSEVAITVSSST